MAKPRFNRAFSTSFLVHALVFGLFVVLFSLTGHAPDSGKIEQFEISERSGQVKKAQKGPKEAHVSSESTSVNSTHAPVSMVQKDVDANDVTTENGISSGKNSYESALRSRIAQQERYPLEARKRHLESTVEIEFEVGEHGELLQISVKTPEKPAILVEAARAAVEQSAPFPPPPPGISHKFVVPIDFKISK